MLWLLGNPLKLATHLYIPEYDSCTLFIRRSPIHVLFWKYRTMPISNSLLLISGTREVLGNLQWSPRTVPPVFTAVHQMANDWWVPTTTGSESSGPFGLVILSLLGSAVSTVDYKRERAKIVLYSAWGKVVSHLISITMYKISLFHTTNNFYLHSKNIYSSAKVIKLHSPVYIRIMYALWACTFQSSKAVTVIFHSYNNGVSLQSAMTSWWWYHKWRKKSSPAWEPLHP